MQNDALSGVHYFFSGMKLLFKPGLKRFVIIPAIINFFLFIGLFLVIWHFLTGFNHWLNHYLPSWLQWLSAILWIVFLSGFLLIFVYTFVAMANIIAAPFNGLLAEKIEVYLTGKPLPQKKGLEVLTDIPRILKRQFSLIGYYVPRAIVLLLFFLIPILQIFAAFIWFLFNAWFMTLQYLDYPTDNHRIPLETVQAWLKQHRLLSLSFGSVTLIMTLIPFLNLISIPAAVAGAT